jgi:hypothetical protein
MSQVTTQLGLQGSDDEPDKTLHQRVDDYLALISGLLSFYASMEDQLEFLTLTGIIFNALMSGYVCANSIYVYLIENIETAPLDISASAFTGGVFTDKSDLNTDAKEAQVSKYQRTCLQIICCREHPKAREKREWQLEQTMHAS